jgi:hypothetical protein
MAIAGQAEEMQIPFGNDNQESNDNSNGKSKFRWGMTTRRTTTTANADSLRE